MSTPTLTEMTKEERSLLLFFESGAVEQGGWVRGAHMNSQDYTIAAKWNASGFITFRRIRSKRIRKMSSKRDPFTHDVELSPAAWSLAQEERRNRSARIRVRRADGTP